MKNRKKQYLRSLKLAKKFAAVAMLSATLAGASTSIVKLTSSTAYAAEQTGRRVEKIPFKTETNEKSGVMYSILGLIGAAALAESIRRKRQSK